MAPEPGAPPGWVTTTEAAQRLGVKRATLYAYVSRGVLRSERRPGQQESLFDRAQIDALASSAGVAGSSPTVLRFRSIATAVTSQVDGDLLYRGVPLAEVVGWRSLERAAAHVVGAPSRPGTGAGPSGEPATPSGPGGRGRLEGLLGAVDLARLPLERRLPVAVQLVASADPFSADPDPERVRAAAVRTVTLAVSLAARAAGSPVAPSPRAAAVDTGAPGHGDLTRLALAALGGDPGRAADVEVLRVLHVALLDHGLTASTVAARVAASTRAGLADCLAAAYAAMSGPLHGAAPVAAHALLADDADPAVLVARSVRDRGVVPGFGHFLYPEGDPRAEVVLAALWRRRGTTGLRRRVEALARVVADHTGALPNIDLASAAVLHALGLPAAAGEVVFQVARSFGVAAHVVEELAEEPLRWRGRDPGT